MTALKAWLLAGSPAHWIVALLVAYALACWALSKLPKVRANTVAEAFFNALNPIAIPYMRKIPLVGPVLVMLVDLFDSPQPKPSMVDATSASGGANATTARYTRESGRASLLVLLCLAGFGIFAALTFAGCAPGTDGARQALTAAEQLETQAIGSLESFDATYQAQIVEQHKVDVPGGEKALQAYRIKRAEVVKVVLDVATVTATGKPLIALVDLGLKKSSDLGAWLASLIESLAKLRTALSAFGVSLPGGF